MKEGALGREPGRDDGAAAPASRPRPPATVEPLAPALYQVKFTADQELHDKLERLQALMRTTVPNGDLGAIIDAAVTEKLERLEAKKLGKTKTSRKTLAETDTTPTSRYIPAPVRREVWERDALIAIKKRIDHPRHREDVRVLELVRERRKRNE